MDIQIEEKRSDTLKQARKSHNGTIILSKEEFDKLETAFCKGKGWSRDTSTNLHKIVLRGNYKWHPLTDIELDINVRGIPDGI